MKKIFFYIDRTNKQIRFIHYPIDRKGNMIGETEQHSSISFDDVLTMTEEMNRSFFSDLRTICERLQYYSRDCSITWISANKNILPAKRSWQNTEANMRTTFWR